MGFVESFGNPGVASAAQGANNYLQTKRDVVETQLSRVMAVKQLEMQQQQGELALDKFAFERERSNQVMEQGRLQLGLSGRAMELDEKRFNLQAQRDQQELELESKRGRAAFTLARAMSDGEVSEEEYEELATHADSMEPKMLQELMMVGRQYATRERQMKAEKEAQANTASMEWLFGKGKLSEEQIVQAQLLEAQGQVGAVGDLVRTTLESHVRAEGARKDGVDRVNAADEILRSRAAQQNMTTEELFAANQMMAETMQMLETDPTNPAIASNVRKIQRMAIPKEDREKITRYEEQQAREAVMPPAEYLNALPAAEQQAWLRAQQQVDTGIAQYMGAPASRASAARLKNYVKRMETYGIKVNPNLRVPSGLATPDMLRYAFTEMENIAAISDGLPMERQIELKDHALRMAGLEPSDEVKLMYEQWREDPLVVGDDLTTDEYAARALEVARHRNSKVYAKGMVAERARIEASGSKLAQENEKIMAAGGAPVQMTAADASKAQELQQMKIATFRATLAWEMQSPANVSNAGVPSLLLRRQDWKDAGLTERHWVEYRQWREQNGAPDINAFGKQEAPFGGIGIATPAANAVVYGMDSAMSGLINLGSGEQRGVASPGPVDSADAQRAQDLADGMRQ
jgi:hypothetical protein